MDRKISDEQIDRVAENLLKNFALDESAVKEIAASPQLWRNVRGRIADEKVRREKSWFAVFRTPALAFGAAAFVAFGGFALWFLNSENEANLTANQNLVRPANEEIAGNRSNIPSTDESVNPQNSGFIAPSQKITANISAPKPKLIAKKQTKEKSAKTIGKSPERKIAPASAAEETKTDFIALTYAPETDSGQIVRVKVPGSMMVALGVKANVEKESELVNAEVLLGDDGMARAIRFIL